MSRVMWGSVTADSLKSAAQGGTAVKRQTTLPFEVRTRKRDRDGGDGGGGNGNHLLNEAADDGVLYGPSGGGDRETQKRRAPRPFFNGASRPEVFDQNSPYSKAYVEGIQQVRKESTAAASSTTEYDEELLAPFLAPSCPRDVLQGKVFFLNSCDADPLISVYLLEKLIRRMGGHTSMAVSGLVSYVVTQHLSSAKELKLTSNNRNNNKGRTTKYIHPHFVLECAKNGLLVPEGPYLTMELALGSASSNIANARRPQLRSHCEGAAAKETTSISGSSVKMNKREVIEID